MAVRFGSIQSKALASHKFWGLGAWCALQEFKEGGRALRSPELRSAPACLRHSFRQRLSYAFPPHSAQLSSVPAAGPSAEDRRLRLIRPCAPGVAILRHFWFLCVSEALEEGLNAYSQARPQAFWSAFSASLRDKLM